MKRKTFFGIEDVPNRKKMSIFGYIKLFIVIGIVIACVMFWPAIAAGAQDAIAAVEKGTSKLLEGLAALAAVAGLVKLASALNGLSANAKKKGEQRAAAAAERRALADAEKKGASAVERRGASALEGDLLAKERQQLQGQAASQLERNAENRAAGRLEGKLENKGENLVERGILKKI